VGLIDDVPTCEDLLARIEKVYAFYMSCSNLLGSRGYHARHGKKGDKDKRKAIKSPT
jgi:hypothetical protein